MSQWYEVRLVPLTSKHLPNQKLHKIIIKAKSFRNSFLEIIIFCDFIFESCQVKISQIQLHLVVDHLPINQCTNFQEPPLQKSCLQKSNQRVLFSPYYSENIPKKSGWLFKKASPFTGGMALDQAFIYPNNGDIWLISCTPDNKTDRPPYRVTHCHTWISFRFKFLFETYILFYFLRYKLH